MLDSVNPSGRDHYGLATQSDDLVVCGPMLAVLILETTNRWRDRDKLDSRI